MMLAVLEARCGLSFGADDVYLNVAGGLRIAEPAADLAVAAALVSALADEPVPPEMVVFGEIGLGGEVRPVGQREARLREAAKLGFRSALVPRGRAGSGPAPRRPRASLLTKSSIWPTLSRASSRQIGPSSAASRGRPGTKARVTPRTTSKGSTEDHGQARHHRFRRGSHRRSPCSARRSACRLGFAHAVLFIVSWVGAGWIALNYSHLIEPEVVKLVQSAELAKFGSMLVVFVGALIVLVIVTNALSRTIRLSPLNKPDRILGAGLRRGLRAGSPWAWPSCSSPISAPSRIPRGRRGRALPFR